MRPVVLATKTKLCHAYPGDRVTFIPGVDARGYRPGDTFILCVVADKDKRGRREHEPHGLYDEDRTLFLFEEATGLLKPLPHLSTRVLITRKYRVHNTMPGAGSIKNTVLEKAASAEKQVCEMLGNLREVLHKVFCRHRFVLGEDHEHEDGSIVWPCEKCGREVVIPHGSGKSLPGKLVAKGTGGAEG